MTVSVDPNPLSTGEIPSQKKGLSIAFQAFHVQIFSGAKWIA